MTNSTMMAGNVTEAANAANVSETTTKKDAPKPEPENGAAVATMSLGSLLAVYFALQFIKNQATEIKNKLSFAEYKHTCYDANTLQKIVCFIEATLLKKGFNLKNFCWFMFYLQN